MYYSDSTPLVDLEWPANIGTRVLNCCRNEGWETVGDVRRYSDFELMRVPNLGKQGVLLIRHMLRNETAEEAKRGRLIDVLTRRRTRLIGELEATERELIEARASKEGRPAPDRDWLLP